MTQKNVITFVKSELEKSKDLTQGKLAKSLGVSRQFVNSWLNGKREINEEFIPGVAAYLGVETSRVTGVALSDNFVDTDLVDKKYEVISQDLTNQLESQNKYGRHYEDLIDHAVYLFKLKDTLQDDIQKNGIRIVMQTGNGHQKEIENASIRNLNSVSSQIIKVLTSLGLNEPDIDNDGDIDDL